MTTSNDYSYHQRKSHYNNTAAQTHANTFYNSNNQNNHSNNYNHRLNYSRPNVNHQYSPYRNVNETLYNANYYSSIPNSNFQQAFQNQSRR